MLAKTKIITATVSFLVGFASMRAGQHAVGTIIGVRASNCAMQLQSDIDARKVTEYLDFVARVQKCQAISRPLGWERLFFL